MKEILITSKDIAAVLRAMETDLTNHLLASRCISVEGEIAVARELMAATHNNQDLVLSEENEMRMWAIAQAAMTAVLIGCVDRGTVRPKTDVN